MPPFKPLTLVLLLLALAPAATPASANVFVHLFEWRWDDIARECESFLGPHGYSAVQISPPNEHRMLLGRPWYERYQPLSYKLDSRSGDRAALAEMISRCHAAGVQVYADAVINHMASCRPQCDSGQPQYGDRGVAGSRYTPGAYRFDDLFAAEDEGRVAGALDAYEPHHFHHQCTQVSDWNDAWQVQNCELERLADLATERDDVRATLANYLASLLALGVDGLRIDAAKHLPTGDLHAILERAAQAADVRIEGTAIHPGGSRSVLVFQEYIGNPPDLDGAYANGKVTEFNFGQAEATAFLNWDGLTIGRAARLIGEWRMQPGERVVTFIDNHDNQRGHGGGGRVFAHRGGDGRNYGIRNDLAAYRLANLFMLAYPYGYPKVISSYAFGDGELWDWNLPAQDVTEVAGMAVHDDFIGPPHLGGHRARLSADDYPAAGQWQTQSLWQENGASRCDLSPRNWLCEHRWPAIAGMVGFRAATTPYWGVSHWWDDGHNRLAFGRGGLGFVAINGELWSDQDAFGPEGNGWYQTGMPAGDYCDVVHSRLSDDHHGCVATDGSAAAPITVHADGKARLLAAKRDAAAIHVGARIEQ